MTVEQLGASVRWGHTISNERKEELQALANRQQVWAANPSHDLEQSVFKAVHLTGAEVFFLAAYTLVRPDSNIEQTTALLRVAEDDRDIRFSLDLSELHLEGASLRDAHLERAILRGAHLEHANLYHAHLERADLSDAHFEGSVLAGAHLEHAFLRNTRLEGAFLSKIHLAQANLTGAHLENAIVRAAYLEGANLTHANLAGADLRWAFLDAQTDLDRCTIAKQFVGPRVADIHWGDTSLIVVQWKEVKTLADEAIAKQRKSESKSENGRKTRKSSANRRDEYEAAARAYRLLATTLRSQGIAAPANRFHYRAELMERRAHFHDIFARLFSRHFYTAPAAYSRWLFSWLLGVLAGYGDKLGRLLMTYFVVVSVFAGFMLLFADRPPSVDSIRDVFVLSITSFHGRGVQPPGLLLNDALATLTAVEAFFGLAIEGIFIAAFTRRVTGH